jgi:WD40 repeat protein
MQLFGKVRSNNTRITIAVISSILLLTLLWWWRQGPIAVFRVPSRVFDMALSPDGQMVAAAVGDVSRLYLWDITGSSRVQTIEGIRFSEIAFSPGGDLLATNGTNGSIALWSRGQRKQIRLLESNADSVTSLVFSPDGHLLASGHKDGTIHLWHVEQGVRLNILTGHTLLITGLAFSPDGQWLASGGYDYTVKVWRVRDGKLQVQFRKSVPSVKQVAFSLDGQFLAAGGANPGTQVIMWRVSNWQTVLVLKEAHPVGAISIAFSPDSRILASASGIPGNWMENVKPDPTIRLWRVPDGKLLRTIRAHSDNIAGLAFTPDGTRLVSGSWDKTMKVWRIE